MKHFTYDGWMSPETGNTAPFEAFDRHLNSVWFDVEELPGSSEGLDFGGLGYWKWEPLKDEAEFRCLFASGAEVRLASQRFELRRTCN